MGTQVHSTIFGQLLRMLSGNTIFQYPDEIDPSLWKKAIQHDTTSTASPPRQQPEAYPKETDSGNNLSQSFVLEEAHGVQDDSLVVDWYGPDDPEASAPAGAIKQTFLRHRL